MGATSQHAHLSFLYTFHAYSSHIYQHTTKIKPILLFPINLIHVYIDKYMLLGEVIYLKSFVTRIKFYNLRKYGKQLSIVQ
jgi:hypothetical protein